MLDSPIPYIMGIYGDRSSYMSLINSQYSNNVIIVDIEESKIFSKMGSKKEYIDNNLEDRSASIEQEQEGMNMILLEDPINNQEISHNKLAFFQRLMNIFQEENDFSKEMNNHIHQSKEPIKFKFNGKFFLNNFNNEDIIKIALKIRDLIKEDFLNFFTENYSQSLYNSQKNLGEQEQHVLHQLINQFMKMKPLKEMSFYTQFFQTQLFYSFIESL